MQDKKTHDELQLLTKAEEPPENTAPQDMKRRNEGLSIAVKLILFTVLIIVVAGGWRAKTAYWENQAKAGYPYRRLKMAITGEPPSSSSS